MLIAIASILNEIPSFILVQIPDIRFEVETHVFYVVNKQISYL